jgi:hypothetical protein
MLAPHRWRPPGTSAVPAGLAGGEPGVLRGPIPGECPDVGEDLLDIPDIPAYAEDWEVADGWGLGLGFDDFDP